MIDSELRVDQRRASPPRRGRALLLLLPPLSFLATACLSSDSDDGPVTTRGIATVNRPEGPGLQGRDAPEAQCPQLTFSPSVVGGLATLGIVNSDPAARGQHTLRIDERIAGRVEATGTYELGFGQRAGLTFTPELGGLVDRVYVEVTGVAGPSDEVVTPLDCPGEFIDLGE